MKHFKQLCTWLNMHSYIGSWALELKTVVFQPRQLPYFPGHAGILNMEYICAHNFHLSNGLLSRFIAKSLIHWYLLENSYTHYEWDFSGASSIYIGLLTFQINQLLILMGAELGQHCTSGKCHHLQKGWIGNRALWPGMLYDSKKCLRIWSPIFEGVLTFFKMIPWPVNIVGFWSPDN